MPKNTMTKSEVEVRILKLKNELYEGGWTARNDDWHNGAHEMLNSVLNILQEYRE